MKNKYMAPQWTMQKLIAEQDRIFKDTSNKNPDTKSIHLLTKSVGKKLTDIGRAITELVRDGGMHES